MAIEPHPSLKKLSEQIAEVIGGAGGGTSNHENLNNLLGGNNSGHYHLTSGERDKLLNIPAEGVKGEKGDKGEAATIEIGTVTTGAAGTQAKVVNVGTLSAARLNFTIPRGDKGERGDAGDSSGEGISDHEQLNNLLGGSANNHYHLTLAERNKLTNYKSESWTFTLENGNTVTKQVVLAS